MIYSKALQFYNAKDYSSLENIFQRNLNHTTDINLFVLYIKYIESKNLGKQNDVVDQSYWFIFDKLKFHWDVYIIIRKYIKFLKESAADETEYVEKMREVYQKFMVVPIPDMHYFWEEYEEFEKKLNRLTAKKILLQLQPVYIQTQRLSNIYMKLVNYGSGLIQNYFLYSHFTDIVQIEEKNVCMFDEQYQDERIRWIFKFFADKFAKEKVFFVWSEYLLRKEKSNECQKVIKDAWLKQKTNLFLTCYLFQLNKNVQVFEDALKLLTNDDYKLNEQNNLVDRFIINYMSAVYKTKGLDEMRKVFRRFINQNIGPYVFIHAAKIENFSIRNKNLCLRILQIGLEKYDDNAIKDACIDLYLENGDLLGARKFCDTFCKSKRITDIMADFEFYFGNNEKYRDRVNDLALIENEAVKGNSYGTFFSNYYDRLFDIYNKKFLYFEGKTEADDVMDSLFECISDVNLSTIPRINSDYIIRLLQNLEVGEIE